MSEANVALVKSWFEHLWNLRRESVVDELLCDGSVCHSDTGVIRGPVEFRTQQVKPFLSAFPDLRVNVEGTIGEGDQVAVRWHAVGTHTGDGLGIPATGERAEFHGMTWVRVADGKLMEGWQRSDIPEVLRKLAERAAAGA